MAFPLNQEEKEQRDCINVLDLINVIKSLELPNMIAYAAINTDAPTSHIIMDRLPADKLSRFNMLKFQFSVQAALLMRQERQLRLQGTGPLPRSWETLDKEEGELLQRQMVAVSETRLRMFSLLGMMVRLTLEDLT